MSKIQTITTETIRSVSIAQALELVPFGETTLRALMDNGRLPFSRIPGANPKGRGPRSDPRERSRQGSDRDRCRRHASRP